MAGQQARQARLLAEDTRARLVRVRNALPAPVEQAAGTTATPTQGPTQTAAATLAPEAQAILDRLAASQATDAAQASSPVPNKVEQQRARQTTTRGPDRGPER